MDVTYIGIALIRSCKDKINRKEKEKKRGGKGRKSNVSESTRGETDEIEKINHMKGKKRDGTEKIKKRKRRGEKVHVARFSPCELVSAKRKENETEGKKEEEQ